MAHGELTRYVVELFCNDAERKKVRRKQRSTSIFKGHEQRFRPGRV